MSFSKKCSWFIHGSGSEYSVKVIKKIQVLEKIMDEISPELTEKILTKLRELNEKIQKLNKILEEKIGKEKLPDSLHA